MTEQSRIDPRELDPNNPVEIVKRGYRPDAGTPQGSNQYALLDYAVVRLLPSRTWSLLGVVAAVALIALIAYLFA